MRSVSLVIEWANAQAQAATLSTAVLDAVGDQLPIAGWRADVLLMNDPESAVGPGPSLAASRLASHDGVEVLDVPAHDYYEQKNTGARHVTGDVVVLLDSDSIPEDGWLEHLLAPFDDPEVGVVAGSTYLGRAPGLLGAWYSVNWKFGPRGPDGPTRPATVLRANNLAFRRELFLAHPFPADRRYRGRCATLFRQLRKEGVPVLLSPCARVCHAPPAPGTFLRQALADGHDRAVPVGSRHRPGPVGVVRAFGDDVRRFTTSTVRGRRDANLGPLRLPAALVVGVAWSTASAVGMLVELLRPGWLRRHLSI